MVVWRPAHQVLRVGSQRDLRYLNLRFIVRVQIMVLKGRSNS